MRALVTAASIVFLTASNVSAQGVHSEQGTIETHASDATKFALDFHCQDAKFLGQYDEDPAMPISDELGYAVSEGYCAGYIVGVVQLLYQLQAGNIDISDINGVCLDLPDNFYRAAGDAIGNNPLVTPPTVLGPVISAIDSVGNC